MRKESPSSKAIQPVPHHPAADNPMTAGYGRAATTSTTPMEVAFPVMAALLPAKIPPSHNMRY